MRVLIRPADPLSTRARSFKVNKTMKVLALNCGSATVKFQLVEIDWDSSSYSRHRKLARGLVDGIGDRAKCRFEAAGEPTSSERIMPLGDLAAAVRAVIEWLDSVPALRRPDAIGHRVVHGGSRYTSAILIDEAVLADLDALCEIAPLHNPATVSAIHAARQTLGVAMPMVAVFDTAFHHTIPAAAATYALPWEVAQRHDIRRYGFHGLAYQYNVARYAELVGKQPAAVNAVILHLGNGCSAAAIRRGQSVETSMGFTPLEGLVMGTRSGDIDPALVAYLARREGMTAAEVETWLNKRAGLLGISGVSNDMRTLLAARDANPRARLAVEVFCHRARKYLGAYLAVLGGAEAVVFSGGIGENAAAVRQEICRGMEWSGMRIDAAANATPLAEDRCISAADSALEVWIVHTDEEAVIARETAKTVRS
jgi:acetate kinase